MKHRALPWIVLLILLPLFFAGCFLQGPAAPGSIAFSLSSKALSRSITAGADTIRVYLMSGGTLYPIKTAGYDEATITGAGATYTSPSVPAGTYKLMIAVGKKDTNGYLVTTDYADPVDLTISPGANTPITVTLKPAPFVPVGLWGRNATGASLVGYSGYVTTEDALYPLNVTAPITLGTGVPVPTGYTVNSLSPGLAYGDGTYPVPWLNTNHGILPYNGSYDQTFASAPGNVNALSSVAGISSGAIVAIYQREGGMGGALISYSGPSDWYDVDLSQFLSGKPILDIVASPGINPLFAYAATSLGAFRLGVDTFDTETSPSAEKVLKAAKFFKVTGTDGNEIPILSLAMFHDNSTLANTLLIGTKNGLYTAVPTEDPLQDAILGTPALIAETAGNAITRIVTTAQSGGAMVAAFCSDTEVFLYDGSTVKRYLFYAGLPEDLPKELNAIMLAGDSNGHINLVVAGEKGLAAFDTGIPAD